jgi:hypothetical protein
LFGSECLKGRDYAGAVGIDGRTALKLSRIVGVITRLGTERKSNRDSISGSRQEEFFPSPKLPVQ